MSNYRPHSPTGAKVQSMKYHATTLLFFFQKIHILRKGFINRVLVQGRTGACIPGVGVVGRSCRGHIRGRFLRDGMGLSQGRSKFRCPWVGSPGKRGYRLGASYTSLGIGVWLWSVVVYVRLLCVWGCICALCVCVCVCVVVSFSYGLVCMCGVFFSTGAFF